MAMITVVVTTTVAVILVVVTSVVTISVAVISAAVTLVEATLAVEAITELPLRTDRFLFLSSRFHVVSSIYPVQILYLPYDMCQA
ncbi:unnamed protein product [Nippostrongylus brasiliensis]|uniref:Secreted protein n=1 Tax=Nippostrongylus brasiliensis TaxID=27835 RepID=A0A0N4Y189_NIPBR|nr:unnamed protein product [Nippostrongylus brasiliensis]